MKKASREENFSKNHIFGRLKIRGFPSWRWHMTMGLYQADLSRAHVWEGIASQEPSPSCHVPCPQLRPPLGKSHLQTRAGSPAPPSSTSTVWAPGLDRLPYTDSASPSPGSTPGLALPRVAHAVEGRLPSKVLWIIHWLNEICRAR